MTRFLSELDLLTWSGIGEEPIQIQIQIDIEKLPGSLLFEVPYRLPCRSALQYKSVSKMLVFSDFPFWVCSSLQYKTPLLLRYTMSETSYLFHSIILRIVAVTTESIFSTSFHVWEKIILFTSKHRTMTYHFDVWELEDYGNADTWCLKHIVYMKDLVSECSDLDKIAMEIWRSVSFLAFHPTVVEIAFLQFRNYIVLCNMQTIVKGKS